MIRRNSHWDRLHRFFRRPGAPYPPRHKAKRKGLTLIELLVVVSVLGILATIAVVHLKGAGTRAKVSRVFSDLRTLELGIEAYRADHNTVPRMAHFDFFADTSFDLVLGEPVNGVMSRVLSTPVAYVSNPHMIDIFAAGNDSLPVEKRLFTYQDIPAYRIHRPSSSFWPLAQQFYGDWRLGSIGPDMQFSYGFTNSAQLPYDPTNGVVSAGNIWGSQKARNELPPIPSMLGEH